MKFYYIDDSYFKESLFLCQMRDRLLTLCKRDHVSIIFISGKDVVGIQFEDFVDICSEHHIQVVCSPAHFDIYGIQGVLTTSNLMIDGFDNISTYSGSFVSIDSESKEYERIYLEFFPTYLIEQIHEDVVQEIEEILGDVLMKHKKKQKYN